MAKSGFKVMDSDMHVIEPRDLWQRYIEPAFLKRAPKGVDRFLGDMLIEVEGRVMPTTREDWASSKADQRGETYRDSYESGWDPASQVRAMDEEGIDVAFLYPSRGLYPLAFDQMDPILAAAIARAYNNWMGDFCNVAPGRMFGAAMVSPFDVESAVLEARRAIKELSFKAIFLRPNIVCRRNWHDPYYDPLWAEIQDLGVPLGFHEGSDTVMNQVGNRFETFMMLHTCCHPMEMMLAVVDMIGGGVFERFPRLKVAFLEANCSWLPWFLWRLDEHFELSGRFESPELKLKPSAYFRRQGFISIEAEEEHSKVVEQSGLMDTVVFSTDYPHEDSKYPHATDTFLKLPLKKQSKRRILWDNCARLYGLD